MSGLVEVVRLHPALAQYIVTVVATAAISSMPTPTGKSGPFYQWLYGTSHALLGMVGRVAAGVRGARNSEAGQ